MTSTSIYLNILTGRSHISAIGQASLDELISLMPLLLGVPIAAFFGWLVYRHIWPDPPAPALR